MLPARGSWLAASLGSVQRAPSPADGDGSARPVPGLAGRQHRWLAAQPRGSSWLCCPRSLLALGLAAQLVPRALERGRRSHQSEPVRRVALTQTKRRLAWHALPYYLSLNFEPNREEEASAVLLCSAPGGTPSRGGMGLMLLPQPVRGRGDASVLSRSPLTAGQQRWERAGSPSMFALQPLCCPCSW